MSPATVKFFQRWLVTTVAVLMAANIVPGIEYRTVGGLLTASLLLGIFNAILRPVMLLLSLPLLIVTLGLFVLVINALLLYLVDFLVKSFEVSSFGSAFLGALVISIVSIVVNLFLGTGKPSRPPPASPRSPPPDQGGGPIIDV